MAMFSLPTLPSDEVRSGLTWLVGNYGHARRARRAHPVDQAASARRIPKPIEIMGADHSERKPDGHRRPRPRPPLPARQATEVEGGGMTHAELIEALRTIGALVTLRVGTAIAPTSTLGTSRSSISTTTLRATSTPT